MLNSTLASSAPAGVWRSMQASLGYEVSILVILIYFIGYILGPIVFAVFREFLTRSSLKGLKDGVYS